MDKKIQPVPHHFLQLYPSLMVFTACLFVLGICLCSVEELINGLKTIILTEDSLITDYVKIAGPGPALVNSAIVTAISLWLLYLTKESHNGMTLVITGLMSGFSLFGKNFVNIWPILFGAWFYAWVRDEPLSTYTPIGLMSTALSPIVSYIFLDNGFGNPFIAVTVGFTIGFIMPPLTAYTYRIQNGMNLYNVGFACGLVAFICVPLLISLGADPTTRYDWAQNVDHIFFPMILTMCFGFIFVGLILSDLPIWATWAGYRVILQSSGRAPSDYLRMVGACPVLINTGVNGLIGLAFIYLGGGYLNGPTVGGILTLMGFSAFGKHAGNIIPVMGGVFLGSLFMDWSLSDPAVQLACLFCTTLAPVSGYFGWPYGVLAGFLHSSVVLYTGNPVAGMNLYNNGFSGGLIAIVLYPIILAVARHRKPVLEDLDFMEDLESDTYITPPNPHEITEPMDIPTSRKISTGHYYSPKKESKKWYRHFFE